LQELHEFLWHGIDTSWGEIDTSEDAAIDNLSPTLKGDHEVVLFELDNGTYVIDKKELIDFLLKQGKKTSQEKQGL